MLPKRTFLSHFLWAGLAILIVSYLVYQLLSIALAPKIILTQPDQKEIRVKNEEILIRGCVKRTYFLRINGEMIASDKEGNFEESVRLQEGLNVLDIEAESRFGKKTHYQLRILRTKTL